MDIDKLLANINYSNFTHRIDKLKLVAPEKSPLFPSMELRSLREDEIVALERQGNISADWKSIQVTGNFKPDRVWQNHFIGCVVLGHYSGKNLPDRTGGGSLPTGIYRSTIEDSHIGDNCAVHNCPGIYRTLVVRDSLISNSNTGLLLDGNQGILYGNGVSIPVGVETGGREIALYSDLSMELAEYVLRHPADTAIQSAYREHLAEYLERIRFTWTIIDKHSRILDTKSITNTYIGPYSIILGADQIQNSSVFSTRDDPTLISNSSVVRNSIIQDGVEISDAAIIQNSMLFEHSHAEHHGKIIDSIIGPNSGVSKGEITSCLLGPFVGFHHQSLLIAAFWPGGRGNVGYGANVGSNHTSRMPDQECWPGEGMFFGLSCAIKYPANFSQAPYSIIAAGVTTLPQKLEFPFSLINEPVGYYLEVPPGFNNLIPAWGLYNNLYSLKRNEGKYRSRNKAKRNRFDLRLFRHDILEYMRKALEYLENVKERKTIYLPGDIPGIGKNMLTDENRLKAVDAYRFFIHYAEIHERILRIRDGGEFPQTPDEMTRLKEDLQEYLNMLPRILEGTEKSRERDISRGAAIIPDYRDTHPSVDQDPFVLQVRDEIAQERRVTEELMIRLEA
jgi:hypothetical protein